MTMQETRRPQLPQLEYGPAIDGNHNRPRTETWRDSLRPLPPCTPFDPHCLLFAARVRRWVFQVFIDEGERYLGHGVPIDVCMTTICHDCANSSEWIDCSSFILRQVSFYLFLLLYARPEHLQANCSVPRPGSTPIRSPIPIITTLLLA